jgi:hypothetical protein
MNQSRARRRLLAVTTASTLAVASAFAALGLVASPERSADPRPLADEVAGVLREARAEGAATRAPTNLAVAEEAYAQGLLETRREELRLRFLRDFRTARRTLEDARAHARSAADLAERAGDREEREARRSLALATVALSRLEGAEDRVWIDPAVRSRLQRARALASEGTSLISSGAYGTALERARQAARESDAVSGSVLEAVARYADAGQIEKWSTWVSETVAWSRRTGKTTVVVDKDAHRVTVYRGGKAIRSFPAELGWNNVGDKRRQGDGATPEGHYKITQVKGRGRSRYYKALLLDYPNAEDKRNLAALVASGAVPKGTRPGGLIEIHGEGGRGKDWTDGCVAVTNAQMDELFSLVATGTPVVIIGSHKGEGVFAEIARRLDR